jgi:hypothetical protein
VIIKCACGAAISGRSERELLDAARLHIKAEHTGLGDPPAASDLLAMAFDESMANETHGQAPPNMQRDRRERSRCVILDEQCW